MTDEDKARLARYRRSKLKRVPLDMQKTDYDRLKVHAQMSGVPVNRYIKEAIEARMDKEDKVLKIEPGTGVRIGENGKVEFYRRFST